MHFDKLMEHILKIDIEYFAPLDSYINSFLQEIMDMDDYYDNGPKNISTTEILEDITNKNLPTKKFSIFSRRYTEDRFNFFIDFL